MSGTNIRPGSADRDEDVAASSSRWEGNGDLLRTQLQETGRIRLAFLNLAELLAVVNDLGIPWPDVEFEDGYAMVRDAD